MFNYDKVQKKLKEFKDLSSKKQKRLMDSIFVAEDFKLWLKEECPETITTQAMIDNIILGCIRPAVLKYLKNYIADVSLDRLSANFLSTIILKAVTIANKDSEEINRKYKTGSIDKIEFNDYKEKNDIYGKIIDKLASALQVRIVELYNIKECSTISNIDNLLIYNSIIAIIPNMKDKQKTRRDVYTVLDLIYKYAGTHGNMLLKSNSKPNWYEFFAKVFDTEDISLIALDILLEGTRNIQKYSEHQNFVYVRNVWDELSTFALNYIDKAPTRNHIIELYIKGAKTNQANTQDYNPRVDLMNLPSRFTNLIESVRNYSDEFAGLVKHQTLPPVQAVTTQTPTQENTNYRDNRNTNNRHQSYNDRNNNNRYGNNKPNNNYHDRNNDRNRDGRSHESNGHVPIQKEVMTISEPDVREDSALFDEE